METKFENIKRYMTTNKYFDIGTIFLMQSSSSINPNFIKPYQDREEVVHLKAENRLHFTCHIYKRCLSTISFMLH